MIIKKEIYRNILVFSKKYNFEIGGLLGGEKDNVISRFISDCGIKTNKIGCYYPDTSRLNLCIGLWQKKEILFYGIVHSHFENTYSLSKGDEYYIKKILFNMPLDIDCLYFPLVFPLLNQIIGFKAVRKDRKIILMQDNIKII